MMQFDRCARVRLSDMADMANIAEAEALMKAYS